MNQKQYDFPTEVISLPSEGKLYPKDSPLSSGQITIKHMTAKEEDILSSQNLIKKGIVLDKLFESVIVDNVNLDDILIGDKNAIILATRLLGYGPKYQASAYSSLKGEVIDIVVDLSKIETKKIDNSKFDNKNEFEFITPITKNKLTFKLLTHGDEKAIEKDLVALEKVNKDSAHDITTRFRHMITAVDGDNTVGAIHKFVNGFVARDSRAFREHIKTIQPDMDMKISYVHDDGETEVLPIVMGVGFFWPSTES